MGYAHGFFRLDRFALLHHLWAALRALPEINSTKYNTFQSSFISSSRWSLWGAAVSTARSRFWSLLVLATPIKALAVIVRIHRASLQRCSPSNVNTAKGHRNMHAPNINVPIRIDNSNTNKLVLIESHCFEFTRYDKFVVYWAARVHEW